MSDFFSKAYDRTAGAAAGMIPDEVLDKVNPHRRITDLNQESKKLTLTLFGVFSDNISKTTAQTLNRILQAKFLVQFDIAMTMLAARLHDARANGETVDTVRATQIAISNGGKSLSNTFQTANDRSSFHENVSFSFNKRSLSGEMLSEAGDREKKSVEDTVKLSGVHVDGSILARTKGEGSKSEVLAYVKVEMIPVEASKIVDIVGSAKSRSVLFNYYQYRAGKGSFLKDFLVNLNEIDKEVQRNVSDKLEDRLFTDMAKSGGFTTPELLSHVSECRHYILLLEQSDVDTLRSQYHFDLKKPNSLHMVFDRYKVLNLVIVDQIGKNVTFYDSDNPLRGYVFNYEKDLEDSNALSVFSKMLRGG